MGGDKNRGASHGSGRDLQRGGGDVAEVSAGGAGELEEDAAGDMTPGWPTACGDQGWRRAGASTDK
jgi:hypothetical protein